MKLMKYLSAIFMFNIGFAQVYLDIKFKDNQYATAVSPLVGNGYTTNSGLNAILANYGGASDFINYSGTPSGGTPIFSGESYGVNFLFFKTNTTQISALLTDLINYSSLVENASYSVVTYYGIPDSFSDRLRLILTNPTNGSYVSTINNIVQTNNAQLNTVFQNFNVDRFENGAIRCKNCNIVNLKTALQNLTGIVNNVGFAPTAQLSNSEFEKNTTKVFPNPFSDVLNIQSNEEIASYVVFDLLGKKIIDADTKSYFDNSISSVKNGVYVLKIRTNNNKTSSFKIIKNQ
jgi:hypothetical protein